MSASQPQLQLWARPRLTCNYGTVAQTIKPMLASPTDTIPSGVDWAHEVKWDGMRLLAHVEDGNVTLRSRSGRDVTDTFPEIAAELAQTCSNFAPLVLDGEVVAMSEGTPSFSALAERMNVTDKSKAAALTATRPVSYFVFDVLRLLGSDVRDAPWDKRRELLESLELRGTHLDVPASYPDGEALWEATGTQGLEGVVSKRRTSRYAPGIRSPHWLKRAHRTHLSAVVGGWRWQVDTTDRLGAVLLGLPDGDGGWRYAGRCGSGLRTTTAASLLTRLEGTVSEHSPFSTAVPPEDAAGAVWVTPTVVIEVRTLGDAGQRALRQPTFLGVRGDLSPADLSPADLGEAKSTPQIKQTGQAERP